MQKKIIPYIEAVSKTKEEIIASALKLESAGADEIFISNFKADEKIQEEFLATIKNCVKQVDVPILIGVYVKRFEDVKKAFYTGAKAVVVAYERLIDESVVKESVGRFGSIGVIVQIEKGLTAELINTLHDAGVRKILARRPNQVMMELLAELEMELYVLSSADVTAVDTCVEELKDAEAFVSTRFDESSVMPFKYALNEKQVEVNLYESKLDFSEFKLNADGLIPVIVQDYKNSEVLMLAYMNEESYNLTVKTGKMTYFSRSRQSLWVKGETSGHYQYVKKLEIDCDNDTILAKVRQVGAACHTGNRTCFYRNLVEREYDDINPYTVLEDDYNVILDRKLHPKEGSYTNYLFDKGIDKILKKCGEEATEIVIAAKNPDAEELKYEISDFLYHCMVLMVECGVTWDDILKELANRK